MQRLRLPIIVLAALLARPVAGAEVPTVVASIAPVHALVAAVMQGAGTPELIVRPGASPHTYALRPSDARALDQAAAVFWIGPELETFLVKPVASLPTRARIVTVTRLPGIELLPAREGGPWEADEHDHDKAGAGEVDAHLWLDPRNARRIVAAAADALAAVDPDRAGLYRRNAATTDRRLAALDRDLEARLGPVRSVPFVVFHDAYQYLERRYGLNAVGSITVDPERKPGARRIRAIRDRLATTRARCLFAEPQFSPKLIDGVAGSAPVGRGVLDPGGSGIAPGPDGYFLFMNGIADELVRCLGRPG